MENQKKLIHTFGALAELGNEVAHKQNFQEMMRTSLHLLLGSLAIMRGGVARYSRYAHELNMLVMRGLGEEFPLSLSLCYEDERQFLTNGLFPIEVSQAKVLPFFQIYDHSFENRKLELLVPLIVRDEIVGVVLLGEKANGEPYNSYDKEIICAMARMAPSSEYLLRLDQPAMKSESSVADPTAKKNSTPASRSSGTMFRPNGNTE